MPDPHAADLPPARVEADPVELTGEFSFRAELWEHEGEAAWHFVSLPEALADDIEQFFGHRARGFGSIRVEVTVGATRWRTSLFPDNKAGTYLLPIKKAVRASERLEAGTPLEVDLIVLA